MKEIQFHENFQPHKCSKLESGGNTTLMAATLGAGVQDGEMFAALAKHNATAVGGTNMVRKTSLRQPDNQPGLPKREGMVECGGDVLTRGNSGCWRCGMGNRWWPRSGHGHIRDGRR
jgi:hypothetical protein